MSAPHRPCPLVRQAAIFDLSNYFDRDSQVCKDLSTVLLITREKDLLAILEELGFEICMFWQRDSAYCIEKLTAFLSEKGKEFLPASYMTSLDKMVHNVSWVRDTVWFIYRARDL